MKDTSNIDTCVAIRLWPSMVYCLHLWTLLFQVRKISEQTKQASASMILFEDAPVELIAFWFHWSDDLTFIFVSCHLKKIDLHSICMGKNTSMSYWRKSVRLSYWKKVHRYPVTYQHKKKIWNRVDCQRSRAGFSLVPFSFRQLPTSNRYKISWIKKNVYVAWKRGLPRKFARFILFRLICVFWISIPT